MAAGRRAQRDPLTSSRGRPVDVLTHELHLLEAGINVSEAVTERTVVLQALASLSATDRDD